MAGRAQRRGVESHAALLAVRYALWPRGHSLHRRERRPLHVDSAPHPPSGVYFTLSFHVRPRSQSVSCSERRSPVHESLVLLSSTQICLTGHPRVALRIFSGPYSITLPYQWLNPSLRQPWLWYTFAGLYPGLPFTTALGCLAQPKVSGPSTCMEDPVRCARYRHVLVGGGRVNSRLSRFVGYASLTRKYPGVDPCHSRLIPRPHPTGRGSLPSPYSALPFSLTNPRWANPPALPRLQASER